MKHTPFAVAAIAALAAGAAYADGDLTKIDVTEVVLTMGSNDDGMYFEPSDFVFKTGHAYKWVLRNVDEIKHEIAVGHMAPKIFTRKVEISDEAGNMIAEIKGTVHEIEVGAGKTVEWFFVPVQTLDSSKIICAIPGHEEAGMFGTVTLE